MITLALLKRSTSSDTSSMLSYTTTSSLGKAASSLLSSSSSLATLRVDAWARVQYTMRSLSASGSASPAPSSCLVASRDSRAGVILGVGVGK